MNAIEMFSLYGKVAVVTGGAGWLGRQMTEALAEAGANVVIASRNLTKLQAQAKLFSNAELDVTAMRLDQADELSIAELLQNAVERFGKVDVLINNSALWTMNDWTDPASSFAGSMDVNVTGMFMMTRTFGEHMAERGTGAIVNVGSVFGMVGPDFSLWAGKRGGLPDYFVQKGAVLQLTRYAAAKLGPRGVRVNTLSPGLFYKNQSDSFVKEASQRTFTGRMGNSTDLKGAVVFLASDASSYVTGTNLVVDGGYTAR